MQGRDVAIQNGLNLEYHIGSSGLGLDTIFLVEVLGLTGQL